MSDRSHRKTDSLSEIINIDVSKDWNAKQIKNLLDPTLDQDAATKKYVDDTVSVSVHSLTRATPLNGGEYIEIGSFSGVSHNLIVSISSDEADQRLAQQHLVTAGENETGGVWHIARPIGDSDLQYNLLVKVDGSSMAMRLTRNQSFPGTRDVKIKIIDFLNRVFTPSSGTALQTPIPTVSLNTTMLTQYLGGMLVYGRINMQGFRIINSNVEIDGEIWEFSTTITDSNPGAGKFRLNNVTQESSTFMYISDNAKNGADLSAVVAELESGDYIYIEQSGDPTRWHVFQVDGVPTVAAGYLKVPLASEDNGAYLEDGEDCVNILHFAADYTDAEAQDAVQYQADVALAGATPVYADLTGAGWADGDRGYGIGTTSRVFLMRREGVTVKAVELALHSRLHVSEHTYGQPDALDPANIGQYGVAEKTAGGDVEAHKAQHQDGGADEMSVANLSGELADNQPPKSHGISDNTKHSGALINDNITLGDANGLVKDSGVGIGAVTSGLQYQGTWNATTNSPALADGTGTLGHFYIVTVAGSQDLGSGLIAFEVGDWVLHNGSIYEKIDHTDSVASVFGRLGVIVAASGDYTAVQITNTPAGGIAAVTVQAAIDELDTEKEPADATIIKTADIDTLAELNAIITDATLIDTTDARLSDARTPTAHKDFHDPEDGSDPLDTAAPGSINENASAEGSAHSLARSDHNHQHTAGLHENGGGAEINVDDLSGELADGQPAKVIIDSEEGVDSTNSATPQLAFTTTKTLETAKYLVQMQMELSGQTGPGNYAEGTFEYDAGGGNIEIGKIGNQLLEYCVRSMIFILDATAGNYDFEFWFNKNNAGGASVSCRRKRLVITKVVE